MFKKKEPQGPAPLMTIKAVDGEIELHPTHVTLRRTGALSLMTRGLVGEKQVPVTSLTAIQLKKPGLANGYIQFVFMGSQEVKGGLWDATRDENTFFIRSRKEYEQCQALQAEVMRLQQAARHPAPAATPVSVADELTKLADLRDRGIITHTQFAQQRDKLLES